MSRPPGIYFDVPFAEYREWAGINQSSLRHALRSMLHYRWNKDNPEEDDKECFRFGRLTHCGKLEPVELLARYVVMPAFELDPEFAENERPKLTKRYKEKVSEFHRVNAEKEIVDSAWYSQLLGILRALEGNRRAREWMSAEGPVEVSIVWHDEATGLLCKARLDKWDEAGRRVPDLKTTEDGSTFDRSVAKWFYHLQGAFYTDGIRTLTGHEHTFCPIAVEKHAPFGCRAAPLSENAIVGGRSLYRRLLRGIAECERTGIWPGYEDPAEWDVPVPPISLTQGGEPLVTL
jgi:hypothetical protein